MLAAMFREPEIQEDGAYFLDRDPEVFKVIFLLGFPKSLMIETSVVKLEDHFYLLFFIKLVASPLHF